MKERHIQFRTIILSSFAVIAMAACSAAPVGPGIQPGTQDVISTLAAEMFAATTTALQSTPSSGSSPVQPVISPGKSTPPVLGPYITARQETDARSGPGLNYELTHTLGSGMNAIVQGRSADGEWFAISGPGDGPGPLSWVRASEVDFTGDAGSLLVLTPSPTGSFDVPVHFDPGSPPSTACVVEPLPGDLGPVYVRLGPGEQFNITYRLGGWAEVLKTEAGWHMIHLGPGETGYVKAEEVQTSVNCP